MCSCPLVESELRVMAPQGTPIPPVGPVRAPNCLPVWLALLAGLQAFLQLFRLEDVSFSRLARLVSDCMEGGYDMMGAYHVGNRPYIEEIAGATLNDWDVAEQCGELIDDLFEVSLRVPGLMGELPSAQHHMAMMYLHSMELMAQELPSEQGFLVSKPIRQFAICLKLRLTAGDTRLSLSQVTSASRFPPLRESMLSCSSPL